MSDDELDQLENEIPLRAAAIFAAARERALAEGRSVVYAANGQIIREFPDGRKVILKEIEPPTPAVPGTRIKLR